MVALVGAGSLWLCQMWLPQYHAKFNIPVLNMMHYIYIYIYIIFYFLINYFLDDSTLENRIFQNILYYSLFSIPNFFVFFEILWGDKNFNISEYFGPLMEYCQISSIHLVQVG
jgi:hypothetical protein